MTTRNFHANRTSQRFLQDTDSQVKLLFGCVGSGKSSTCMVQLYLYARSIEPGYDGIRRSRWAIVRSTYSQLETTTVKTWKEWYPQEVFGAVKGKSPLYHHIKHEDIDMEVIFIAIETAEDLDRFKSLELTGAYVNECQFFYDKNIIDVIKERTNRYPGKIFGGGFKKPLLILDCNPPSTSHWIYQVFEKDKPSGWSIYKMPPALIKLPEGGYMNNPEADFIDQLPDKDYWLHNAVGASEEYIRVSLCGEYGILEEGRAVHPEYTDLYHYSKEKIHYNESVELGIGWDFGNTPACAVVQLMPDGQLCVIDEYWTEYMSVRAFAQDIVIPHLDKLYPGWRKKYISLHDPAGNAMNSDGRTCQDILRELGIISSPALSNSLQYRRDALKYFTTKMSAGRASFLLSEQCHMLREGLMGKFKYDLIKSSMMRSTKEYQEKPLKNMWSHICEALEYICTNYANNVKIANKTDDISKNIVENFYNDFMKTTRLRSEAWQK